MKTKLFWIVSLFVVNNLLAQFPTNGLIAQYGFDNGSLLTDGANGQSFTQTGTALTQINDRFGNPPTSAVDLNGDYLTRTNLNYSVNGTGNNTQSYNTLSFWVKTGANSADRQVIIDDTSGRTSIGSNNWYGYYIYLKNGKITAQAKYQLNRFFPSSQLLNYTVAANATKVISDNTWHHVVVYIKYITAFQNTYTNQCFIDIYIDGSLNGSNSKRDDGNITTTIRPDVNTGFGIGNNDTGAYLPINRFSGSIDDLLVYNRELTQTEINNIYSYNNYCAAPTTSNFNVASGQTELTVSFNGASSDYDIAYHKQGEPFSSATIIPNIITSSTTITGLIANTNYNVYIRENCNNTTAWSEAKTRKTTRPIGRLYVNTSATGNNNGVSWTDAYTDLNDALLNVISTEEIWIAGGVYKPSTSNNFSNFAIVRNNINIYGGFAGTETRKEERIFGANETILSGDLLGNDSGVVNFANTTMTDNSYVVLKVIAENTSINNLTIANGFNNRTASFDGSAIEVLDRIDDFTVRQCKIKNNVSQGGAGFRANVSNQDNTTTNFKILGCEFENNYSRFGSAILVQNTTTGASSSINVDIANCIFKNNTTADNGTLKGWAGSAIWVRSLRGLTTMNANIVNNTFVGNKDLGTATNVSNFTRTPVVLSRTNSNANHNATLSNNIFWDNETIGGLTSKSVSAAFESVPNNWNFKNSIAEDDFFGIATSDKTNTFNNNPQFTDAANGDFTLSTSSPAIGTGDNMNVIGVKDAVDNLRIFNTTVDMGAYEFGSRVSLGTIYVDKDATGNHDGSSWTDAFNNLQAALSIAETNDAIWIAEGVYKPVTTTNQSQPYEINHFGAKIYGGFTGTEAQLSDRVFGTNETILSGDLLGNDVNSTSNNLSTNFTNATRRHDNSFVIVKINETADNVLLDGLTISDAHFETNTASGAIVKDKKVQFLTIKNCKIKNNISRNACAGIFSEFDVDNTSVQSKLTIENCEFYRNMSRHGTSIYAYVRNNNNAKISISNSLFDGNVASDLSFSLKGFGGSAGWIRTLGDHANIDLDFVNNTVVNSIDNGTGNAALNSNTRAPLGLTEQTTFNGTINAEIHNSIFYNNNSGGGNTSIAQIHQRAASSINVSNSIGQDLFSNISGKMNASNANPLFTDAANRDYTLASSSPAVDAGDNSKAIGLSDLKNTDRIFNITVDMGAYEFGSSTLTLSNDAIVDVVEKIRAYPNPVVNVLRITKPVKSVQLYSINGQLVAATTTQELNVSELPASVYFLKIITLENKILTQKVFKN